MEELQNVVDLLAKLASDDEFRAAFEQDPASVLAEYGIEIPQGTRATLPPKEAITGALTNLARQAIDFGPNYGPFDNWGRTPSWWPGPWGPWGPWSGPNWGGPWSFPVAR